MQTAADAESPIVISANIATPSFIKIFVGDLDVATSFYETAFGFVYADRFATAHYDEIVLTPTGGAGLRIVLCRWKDGQELQFGNACGPIGLSVKNVSAAHDHAVSRGAVSMLSTVTYKAMRFAIVSDPDGHMLELIGEN